MEKLPKILCGKQIKDVLGEGVQSIVYRTTDNLALKVIKEPKNPDNLIELDILSRVDHEYLVKAKSINLVENKICLLMEMGIITLKNYILDDNVNLNQQQKLDLSLAIMKGVDYLHKNFIIHLDLHWSNVILFQQENYLVPKIIDFGMARNFKVDYPTCFITRMPNSLFCPPELIAQKIKNATIFEVGPETDNWAVANLISVVWSKKYLFSWDENDPYTKPIIIFYQMDQADLLTVEQQELLDWVLSFDKKEDLSYYENFNPYEDFEETPGFDIVYRLLNSTPEERRDLTSLIKQFEDWEPQLINYNDNIQDIGNLKDKLLNKFNYLSGLILEEAVKILERLKIKEAEEIYMILAVGLASIFLNGSWAEDVIILMKQFDKELANNVYSDILKQLQFNIYRPI